MAHKKGVSSPYLEINVEFLELMELENVLARILRDTRNQWGLA